MLTQNRDPSQINQNQSSSPESVFQDNQNIDISWLEDPASISTTVTTPNTSSQSIPLTRTTAADELAQNLDQIGLSRTPIPQSPVPLPPLPPKPVVAQPTAPQLPPKPVVAQPTASRQHIVKNFLKSALIFLLAGGTVFLIFTAPSHIVRANYLIKNFGKTKEITKIIDVQTKPAISGAIGAALEQSTFTRATSIPAAESQALAKAVANTNLTNNILVIPKINVRAPIIWNSSSDNKVILSNLQNGVAHYGFTSLPNDKDGNVFITGHSSYYWWDRGKYKTVFALLDKLSVGDQAMIQYDNKIFVYEMTESIVVKPTAVEVTDYTAQPTLSLMTCTPVGTALKRLVVKMKLIRVYPAETSMSSDSTGPSTDNLPTTNLPSQLPQDDKSKLIPGL